MDGVLEFDIPGMSVSLSLQEIREWLGVRKTLLFLG